MAWAINDKEKRKDYWQKVKDKWNKQKAEKWRNDPEWREARKCKRAEYIRNNPAKIREQRAGKLKKRFELLMKFGFKCYYCGRTSRETVLEIDHFYPKSKGGKDDEDNYVVACRECNQGKKDIILGRRKEKIVL